MDLGPLRVLRIKNGNGAEDGGTTASAGAESIDTSDAQLCAWAEILFMRDADKQGLVETSYLRRGEVPPQIVRVGPSRLHNSISRFSTAASLSSRSEAD